MFIWFQIFFFLFSEVFKALNKTRGLYLRWREIGDAPVAESEWTTTELRNSLRSIEWDLEDLEDTINILFKLIDFFYIPPPPYVATTTDFNNFFFHFLNN